MAAADGEWKGMVLAGYYTGARHGDLARMPWSSVDLDDGVIRFTKGNAKRRLAVPIHPEPRKWQEAR